MSTSVPSQQKAVFVKEIGKPVELGTRSVPVPGDGEVLVKVAATMRKLFFTSTHISC
jgi:Zn-dependent alcohol dehydrogenase